MITYEKQYDTVQPVLVGTSIKQSSSFEGQYFVIPNVLLNRNLTCIQQTPAFKDHS